MAKKGSPDDGCRYIVNSAYNSCTTSSSERPDGFFYNTCQNTQQSDLLRFKYLPNSSGYGSSQQHTSANIYQNRSKISVGTLEQSKQQNGVFDDGRNHETNFQEGRGSISNKGISIIRPVYQNDHAYAGHGPKRKRGPYMFFFNFLNYI